MVVDMSPDKKFIVTGGKDRQIKVWVPLWYFLNSKLSWGSIIFRLIVLLNLIVICIGIVIFIYLNSLTNKLISIHLSVAH